MNIKRKGDCCHCHCCYCCYFFSFHFMSLTDTVIEKCLELSKRAALSAGAIIKKAFVEPMNIKRKGVVDFVTETDRKSEDLIRGMLSEEFPAFSFIGEEGCFSDGCILEETLSSEQPAWCVDPLDGTTNFCSGSEYVSVSIALLSKKESVVGVVYNPFSDELFWGVRGKGSFMNGQRLVTSKCRSLSDAIVATNVGVDRSTKARKQFCTSLNELMTYPVRGIRMYGSCALDMCNVARGRLTAYVENGVYPWDKAAGRVIAEESGCMVGQYDGSPFDISRRGVIVANSKEIGKELVRCVRKGTMMK
eukprot:TRINITY_DN81559_c0_g1_i1.p1 TRINITY_DN81559_c0_g1~~TRINITY_DN81559_c0_g1_i1.p1  ORF type:complete len:305 (-),score=71.58 TRINITY_DN81559_c0_g1_i1:98-1012(-)